MIRLNSAFLVLLGLVTPAHAGELSGFAEVRATSLFGVDGTRWSLVERARPTAHIGFGKRLSLVGTVELSFDQGRRLQSEVERTVREQPLGAVTDAFCEWPSEPKKGFGVSAVRDAAQLDRLYVDAYLPGMDLRLGRQALHWGSGWFINPTDPFPQVLFAEPWRPRVGVNAARMTVPVGDHEWQSVVALNDSLTRVTAVTRGTVQAGSTDVSVIGGYLGDHEQGLLGLDVRGTLGIGFWLEAAAWIDRAKVSEEIVVGVDYSLPVLDGLLVAAQYYRHGSGGRDAAGSAVGRLAGEVAWPDCAGVDLDALQRDGAPVRSPLTGRNYALATASLGVVPELTLGWTGLQNLDDGTGIMVPSVRLKPSGWIEVGLLAQLPYRAWGRGGELVPKAEDLTVSVGPGGGLPEVSLDVSGLVPSAAVTGWTRVYF